MSARKTPPVHLTPVEYDPFAGPRLERVVATTESQREVWLAARLGREASLAFNESVSLRFRGALNVPALESALQRLVERHESLRATFSGDGSTLQVASERKLDVVESDFSDLEQGDRERAVEDRRGAHVLEPFDLEQGPLVRAELLHLGPTEHELIITAHHIVCDGWSFWVLVKELATLYCLTLGAPTDALAPADSFTAYALAEANAERTPDSVRHEQYWLGQFADGGPELNLPADRPRPPARTFDSRREDYWVDPSLIGGARRTAARHGASLFAAVLATFAALLYRLTGDTDVVVGVPAAGQSLGGHDSLVGHCVNLLPVRIAVDPARPFTDLLSRVQSTMLDAFEHQQYTFGSLLKKLAVRRDPSRLPLVSVSVNIDQALDNEVSRFPGLKATFIANGRRYENFELFVNAAQVDGGLRLECQFNTSLYDAVTVRRWLSCYETLLSSWVVSPDLAVDHLPWIPDSEISALAALQPVPSQYPRTDTAATLIDSALAAHAARQAARCGTECWTYAELERHANQVAHCLRALGVRRDCRVGVCLERSLEMLAVLVGVLKAGGAYVPLDPSYPSDRLRFMADDAELTALVTRTTLASLHSFAPERTLLLDAQGAAVAASPTTPLPRDAQAADPRSAAYVIYTSGSTGRPKGVAVHHQAVVNLLTSMRREPGMRAEDRLVAVTTISFDMHVTELLLPLTMGAEVVLATRDEAMDGPALRALLEASRATMMQATPATWRLLLETGWRGSDGFTALCGGEPLAPDLAEQLLERCGTLWNLYGPTETTVYSACGRVDAPRAGISIGRPIANTAVYILDSQRQLCPIGVPGEMYIGGDGVALGYLGRPDLTSERFLPDPFSDRNDARLYRTGDRGRWLANGTLQHLGRLDGQVKIRGFRIEPGEVEAALTTYGAVTRAVVKAREDAAGDVRLVAYIVSRDGERPDESALRRHLQLTLPDYMIPRHFVRVERIPVLPNGKIDYRSLPPPPAERPGKGEDYVQPRNDVERLVAGAMATVLSLPAVSVHDDFFGLGGHSLLAARLSATLTREFGVPVPLGTIFRAPTVAALAQVLSEQTRGAFDWPTPIQHRPDQSRAPLSLMQQRVWFLEQLHPGRLTYHTPSAHRLHGPLNEEAFQRAFDLLIDRQSVLRTTISTVGEEPVQVAQPRLDYPLFPAIDLSGLAQEAREMELTRQLSVLNQEPFDFAVAPLFRARMFRLGREEHVFYFMPHHLIWDGWSFDLLYKEMATIYGALDAGEAPAPRPLPVTYGDFSAWQRDWIRGASLERQLPYWTERLSPPLNPLELPIDKPRPPVMSGNGATEWLSIEKDIVDALREIASQHGATVFMSLLAAFYVLLHRHTGQADIVVGTPVRGRERPGLEEIMGFFVDVLPLRLSVAPDISFAALLEEVRDVVVDAFRYPDVPFELLVQKLHLPRDQSRPPIYQALFSYQDVRERPSRWGRLRHGRVPPPQAGAAEDLSLWFVETVNGLVGGLRFSTDLFTSESVRRMGDRYVTLLRAIVAAPQKPVGDLRLLTPEEEERLERYNATGSAYESSALVHEMVARRSPGDGLAVVCGTQRWTYRELDERSNQVAHHLRALGVERGCRVGVCLDRSAEMLAVLLGVLKAGGAYVPLDPSYPADRLRFMLDDAQVTAVVSDTTLTSLLSFTAGRSLLLDAQRTALAMAPTTPLPRDERSAESRSPAYVIYTSGSTGRPKGVAVPHQAVVNFLDSMRREPGIGADDRLVAVTTISFDIHVLELLLPLTVGAEIVLAERTEAMDGQALRLLLETSHATMMQATPATWRLLVDAGWQGTSTFKALCGGETLAPDLAEQLLERCGELWNLYGPTETTVWSTCGRVRTPRAGISIGAPIANTTVHVLDGQQKRCPVGVPGEIYIGGDGVALGYFRRPDLTSERFLPDPFSDKRAARLYRTGDRGRWLADGSLEHLGRLDGQVKVRGFRIELGEIEAALEALPAVRQAAVVVRHSSADDVRIIAYVVLRSGKPATGSELRRSLRASLPDFMIPNAFAELEAFPLTENGKLNRAALPLLPDEQIAEERVHVAPRTPMEEAIADIWRALLGVPKVSVRDNFFDLGGHSLLAAQMANRLAAKTGCRIALRSVIFETLEQMAAGMETQPGTSPQQERPGQGDRTL